MKYLFLFLTIIVFILNCNTIEGQSNPSTKETSKITARSYYYDTKKKKWDYDIISYSGPDVADFKKSKPKQNNPLLPYSNKENRKYLRTGGVIKNIIDKKPETIKEFNRDNHIIKVINAKMGLITYNNIEPNLNNYLTNNFIDSII